MIDLRKEEQGNESHPFNHDIDESDDTLAMLEQCLGDPTHACRIEPIPPNSDIVASDEGELERFNRLRTLVRAGKYHVDAKGLAAAILDSGDLG